jgi:hypothetical protein
LLQIRANASDPGFRESCHVTAKCAGLPKKKFQFLIQIIPKDPDLREIVVRHNLFAKDILVYSEVLPLLQDYVRNRSGSERSIDVSFSVPKFVYGDYDKDQGLGVIVFEDFFQEGFAVRNPQLMLLNSSDITEVVHNLATFHAICVAYQTTEQVSIDKIVRKLGIKTHLVSTCPIRS